MRITSSKSTRPTGVRSQAPARKNTGPRFAEQLSDVDAEVRSISSARSVPVSDALLAVQEVGGEAERRRRAVRHGNDILDHLDELRMGLLLGIFPAAKLQSLIEKTRDRMTGVSDPGLAAVLQEIELRAMVELAKLENLASSTRQSA